MPRQSVTDRPVTSKQTAFLLADERNLELALGVLRGQLAAHMDKGRTSEAMRVAGVIAENERRLRTTKARLGRPA